MSTRVKHKSAKIGPATIRYGYLDGHLEIDSTPKIIGVPIGKRTFRIEADEVQLAAEVFKAALSDVPFPMKKSVSKKVSVFHGFEDGHVTVEVDPGSILPNVSLRFERAHVEKLSKILEDQVDCSTAT